ncbi:MAG: hypothetical protein E4H15_07785 [Syntrophobacterales bacterium]|nr:MAG: hypothetical protein E4H15_07785 [Syntrophobacterales bacterium]
MNFVYVIYNFSTTSVQGIYNNLQGARKNLPRGGGDSVVIKKVPTDRPWTIDDTDIDIVC